MTKKAKNEYHPVLIRLTKHEAKLLAAAAAACEAPSGKVGISRTKFIVDSAVAHAASCGFR